MARPQARGFDVARKDKELHPTMVRLPERLRQHLEQNASLNGRSMNSEIIYRLERSLTADDEEIRAALLRAADEVGGSPSLSDRLDKIEKTLESYASVLKAQQKVAQDALAALARQSKKSDEGEEK
jgi:hypothetical protein